MESNIWGVDKNSINKKRYFSFHYVFQGCENLESVGDIFNGFSETIYFESIFEGCSSLNNVDKDIFKGCNKVKSLAGCFYGCSSLIELDENMFDSMKGSLIEISQSYDSNKKFRGIFEGCSNLQTCPKLWEWSQFSFDKISKLSWDAYNGVEDSTIRNEIINKGLEEYWLENHEIKD